MSKIFIDGATGTTALQIKTLLKPWQDAGKISLIDIADNRDVTQRVDAFQKADITILCLPDQIARDTMPLLDGLNTKVIDASSAHRTDDNWVFGFPELNDEQPERIANARLLTNPGCFATGAISILNPLVKIDLISIDATHTIMGVSGYTGGGKKLIERHNVADDAFRVDNSFGLYSVNKKHKHVDEIKKHSGLSATPIFLPNVINQPRGMIVSIPFNAASLDTDIEGTHQALSDYYNRAGSMVNVAPLTNDASRINFSHFRDLNLTDAPPIPDVTLHVTGWDDAPDSQVTVHALLDNLGKGAGAQVVQNMKLMLG